jgi:DNA-binding response OmpR family regulator
MAEPKKKILILEDDQFALNLYSALLTDDGFNVVATPRAQEAVLRAESPRANLIIVDLMLQDGDGFSAISALRATPGLEKTPIVVLTNLGQEADMEEARKRGANEYLVKSQLRFQEVVDRIKALLA